MTYAMEMHDSRLEEVVRNPDGSGYVLFSASIFRSGGQVFHDPQESGWQKVRFDFGGMRIEGEVGELETWVSNGELSIDGKNENGIVFLPADHTGQLYFEMCLAEDFRTLKIHANRVRSSFLSEFQIEGYWNASGEFMREKA